LLLRLRPLLDVSSAPNHAQLAELLSITDISISPTLAEILMELTPLTENGQWCAEATTRTT
jgi:hypothetical protein